MINTGVVMFNSRDLIKNSSLGALIRQNNIDGITSLLENKNVAGLVDDIYQYAEDFQGTAAGYALYLLDMNPEPNQNHYNILKLLAEKSTLLCNDKAIFKNRDRCFFNFLITMLYVPSSRNAFISDLPFIKSIIKKTKNLNAAGYWRNSGNEMNLMSALSMLENNLGKQNDLSHTQISPLYQMLACEAILRNDIVLIKCFLSREISHYLQNTDEFIKYAQDTYFNADEIKLISDLINMLYKEKKKIQRVLLFIMSENNEIRERMETFTILPYELKQACTKKPYDTLDHLFSEFLYLLHPEKKLTPLSVRNRHFEIFLHDQSEDEISEISSLQNPFNLRELISRPVELQRLLGLTITNGHYSPAAVLLAQILFFKWDEKIEVKKDNLTITEPLLDDELKIQCEKILYDIYQLKPDTLLMFSMQRHQKELIVNLQYENMCLSAKVDEMHKVQQQLMMKLNETHELLATFLLNAQDINQQDKTDHAQKNEFIGNLKMFGK